MFENYRNHFKRYFLCQKPVNNGINRPFPHRGLKFTTVGGGRHDICQKIYATAVLESNILRKKRVNCNNSQFAPKERKYCKTV